MKTKKIKAWVILNRNGSVYSVEKTKAKAEEWTLYSMGQYNLPCEIIIKLPKKK